MRHVKLRSPGIAGGEGGEEGGWGVGGGPLNASLTLQTCLSYLHWRVEIAWDIVADVLAVLPHPPICEVFAFFNAFWNGFFIRWFFKTIFLKGCLSWLLNDLIFVLEFSNKKSCYRDSGISGFELKWNI
jgi:hypothetical protein